MPDISKCSGDGCKLKDQCYRVQVPSSSAWQAWCDFPGTQGKPCIYFIEVTTEKSGGLNGIYYDK